MQKKLCTDGILLLTAIVVMGLFVACGRPVGNDPVPTIALSPIDAGGMESEDTEVPEQTSEPAVQVSPLMSPPETPLPALAVETDAAGIQGYIGYKEVGALGAMIAWFCPFTPNDTGIDGIYILDPSIHPRVEVGSDGWFQAGYIEPGKYVLVVGAEPETARPIFDIERPGHLKVFELVEAEILEIAVDSSLVTIPLE